MDLLKMFIFQHAEDLQFDSEIMVNFLMKQKQNTSWHLALQTGCKCKPKHRLYHSSSAMTSAPHYSGQSLGSLWDSWWTKWHQDRSVVQHSDFPI